MGFPVVVLDRVTDCQHSINRCLVATGQLRADHGGTAPVTSENGLTAGFQLRGHQLSQFDQLATWRYCNRRSGQRAGPAALRLIERQFDRQRIAVGPAQARTSGRIANHLRTHQRADAVEQLPL